MSTLLIALPSVASLCRGFCDHRACISLGRGIGTDTGCAGCRWVEITVYCEDNIHRVTTPQHNSTANNDCIYTEGDAADRVAASFIFFSAYLVKCFPPRILSNMYVPPQCGHTPEEETHVLNACCRREPQTKTYIAGKKPGRWYMSPL